MAAPLAGNKAQSEILFTRTGTLVTNTFTEGAKGNKTSLKVVFPPVHNKPVTNERPCFPDAESLIDRAKTYHGLNENQILLIGRISKFVAFLEVATSKSGLETIFLTCTRKDNGEQDEKEGVISFYQAQAESIHKEWEAKQKKAEDGSGAASAASKPAAAGAKPKPPVPLFTSSATGSKAP
jgi:hypothetical protein